ncbi:hypothetical protein Q5P01_010953 [Channa striata]|uniref:G-protein coupled receptors family 1 profile domain-containing protein n=1 Tax=Channa striata TaxID=64152 RepID=A0AA88MTE3_CHASR|nr:hypothetical protein Q5P01_010953 [Channa striata]
MNVSDNYSFEYSYDYVGNCEQSHVPEIPVLHYLLFCLGVLGNFTVLWVLLRYIKLKTMTDVCLLNLALSDLILAVSLPMWVYSFQDLASCKLITGVYQLGFYSGTLFVTLMSMDRYLAIVHAVAAMRTRTLRYGITASIIVWVVSVVMAIPQTLQLFDFLDTCKASQIINSAMTYAEIIALSHCCVNPVIYAFIGEKFRKSVGKALAGLFCLSPQGRGAFSYRDTTEKETSNTPVRSDY